MTTATTFRHEALVYEGVDEFVRRTASFLRDGVEAGEAMLVAVDERKIDLLREELGGDASVVRFVDMDEVGHNPARIIPLWSAFVAASGEAGVRGIGEPVHARRDAQALVECQLHESLLNVAFCDGPAWTLLCPYDVRELDVEVIEEALRSHPWVDDGTTRPSELYRGLEASAWPSDAPLPPPPTDALVVEFDGRTLPTMRSIVAEHITGVGLGRPASDDFVLAIHELAANSVHHGGGRGTLSLWSDGTGLIAEVSDAGRILDPLAGRVAPGSERDRGRGLWLVNHLVDLLQIRVNGDGGVARIRLDRGLGPQGVHPGSDDITGGRR